MKIHIPAFKAMAKCNSHLDHAAFDLEISDEVLSAAGYEKVVRCKDCTWFSHGYCMRFDDDVTPDDFCSHGHVET